MNLTIENCNNFDSASIKIEEGKLNIKLAPNGTGKSTISRAIILGANGDSLDELTPFKYREHNTEELMPRMAGLENITNVMCFNEDYVTQFVFQQDELLSNSFDILIRNDEFKQLEEEIESLVSDVKSTFTNNPDLDDLINCLQELGKAFKLTSTGISKSSIGLKAFSSGNKIKNIPAGLESYQPFIQSDKSVEWVDWQTKGNAFNELSDSCPYCTSETSEKRERIQQVSQEYDKNTIKHLVSIIEVINKLGHFLSAEAKDKLTIITSLKESIEQEHIDYLISIKKQIDNLIDKLELLKSLSGFDFNEEEIEPEKLSTLKLSLAFYTHLDSSDTQTAIEPINQSINEIIKRAGELKGKVIRQKRQINLLIRKHQSEINDFLSSAGYRYEVRITGEREQSRLKLYHKDFNNHLEGGTQHLSFGEKNAFAIVLFMYECLAKKPDLIILDDPISSFDKNKKFAILEMLFRRESNSCLKSKTVLMLTHDVEPIIDTIKSLSQKFQGITRASFLHLRNGTITEKAIQKSHIKTFASICEAVLETNRSDLIKLIYLRRYFEILDESGDTYQVLSNLFHKRTTPIDYRLPKGEDDLHPQMEEKNFNDGCNIIEQKIPGFKYDSLIRTIDDENELLKLYQNTSNGYEKLQIFRFFGLNLHNSVLQKFINETYHIENEFIAQLNPLEFDTIPEYVLKECDNMLVEQVE
ncbi:hypothetical protein N6H18_15065 [Reichenbachiella agarivorans]|uniref:AAA domain-containing protein n=1 Tax=Reichenbachiella agarivorans TaxID=2979464 RepID=A0ABY6CMC5_9BACT|nr:AAA family ATPase [Reichenbachiella agarivorans]UXP31668.1 hypothetical protein N6H18_15065 [Reichenbachiella agarivorans]